MSDDALPSRESFRFVHRLRVRWAEVDMQKIVFNAHYLMYFDTALAEYWRAMALPYEAAMVALGGDLYVRKATLDFRASARMDDQVDVAMKCARIGNSSIAFKGALFLQDRFLVGCALVYVFADPALQTSKPVPDSLRETLRAFEAGEPMYDLETGDSGPLADAADALRRSLSADDPIAAPAPAAHDRVALQAVARNRIGQPVAAGRLLPAVDGVARIDRVLVHRTLRGGGHGTAVVRALEAAARARGDAEVVLDAPHAAERFFARLGYAVQGQGPGPGPEPAGAARLPLRHVLR